MASTILLVREYSYVVLRGKISNSEDSLISVVILCYYGDSNDIFSVGGSVGI